MKLFLWTVFIAVWLRVARGDLGALTSIKTAIKKIDQGKELTEEGVSLLKKISEGVPEKEQSSHVPLLVFINPKSGGNQGPKLLQQFRTLFDSTQEHNGISSQVYNLSEGGPAEGLEKFREVPELRILACGGDGTVGWILSVLDRIDYQTKPAIGVLPLGTGNDLARALGWGSGYTDGSIDKIISNIEESDVVMLDRWSLKVTPNPDAFDDNEKGKDALPLNVINNYFSFGVDAQTVLEFHEAREANPERYSSQLRNKMFYARVGGKDMLRPQWKNLTDIVKVECGDIDLTPRLKKRRVVAILFLNIPCFAGGAHPWDDDSSPDKPSTDDGMIEVIGFTTLQLPFLQLGGHGTCFAQCKSAKIVTSKTIPMQIDGEAVALKPSIIELSLLNKARMLTNKNRMSVLSKARMVAMEGGNFVINKVRTMATKVGKFVLNKARMLAKRAGELVPKKLRKLIKKSGKFVLNKIQMLTKKGEKLVPKKIRMLAKRGGKFVLNKAQQLTKKSETLA